MGAVCVALGVCGCTALLPYPSVDVETSDADCHDGWDDDGDGAIDCDDDSCGRCVARPLAPCPAGWSSTLVAGAPFETHLCAPADELARGCPDAPPPGVTPIPAVAGALSDYLRDMIAPTPDPDGPPLEAWLAPGVHVESDVSVAGHVRVHGLCGAVLETQAGFTTPFGAGDHLALDHLELRLRDSGVATLPLRDTELSYVRVVSAAGVPPTLAVSASSSLQMDHCALAVPLEVGDGRLTASDTSLAQLTLTRSRGELDRVRIDGDVRVDGGVAALDARDLFVSCGSLTAERGALDLQRAVLVHGRGADGLSASGAGGQRGIIRLEDVTVVSADSCAPGTSLAYATITIGGSDVTLTRVTVREPSRPALLLDLHTSALVRDVTLFGGLRGGGALDVDRLRVQGASDVGVRVIGTSLEAATARLRRVYVENVPATPRERTACAELGGGIAFVPPATGSIEASAISDVGGCALFVPRDVALTRLEASVARTWTALCAPDRADAPALAAGITLEDEGERSSTASALCVGSDCAPPPGCPRPEICDNREDDDLDAAVDCDDSDCRADPACAATAETDCANGVDDDLDGALDCDDLDCVGEPDCPPL